MLFVDASRAGDRSGDDGSQARPFATIAEALAAGGKTIAIAEGLYEEALSIGRDVALRCRCPEKVRLARPIEISASAADITVSIAGCTIAPVDLGADLTASLADWGSCGGGPGARDDGDGIRAVSGAEHAVDLAVRDSVIAGWCAGVRFNAATASSSTLCISRSRLHANRKGLELLNAPLARLTGDGYAVNFDVTPTDRPRWMEYLRTLTTA